MTTQLTHPEHRPYLFLPDSWDAGWRAARFNAAAGQGPASIMVAGDSISNGEAASDYMENGYVEVLRRALIQRIGRYADFYPAYAYSPGTPGGFAGTSPWTDILNGNSANAYTNNSFTAMKFNSASPVPGTFQSFTSPDPCTAMDLIYHEISGGTFKYQVDANPLTTITCLGVAPETHRAQITGLPNTKHTLIYGFQDASLAMGVVGACTYSGRSGGLAMARIAWSGAKVDNYRTGFGGGDFPANRTELIQGKTPGNDATNNTGWGFPHQPDLLILQFGINDCGGGTDLGNFSDQLDRFCQAARRGKPDASILFLVPWFGNTLATDVAPSQNNGLHWAQYVSIIYRLAQQYSAAVFSVHAKWGSAPHAAGLCTAANDLHPTDAGHADIAATLAAIL